MRELWAESDGVRLFAVEEGAGPVLIMLHGGMASHVAVILDGLGADRAVIGGVSSGSGVALRFALRHLHRTLGLVLIKPVYAGEERGYTEPQTSIFGMMDAVASRALLEGVQVLRPLYERLPDGVREKALAMMAGFDPASVVATGHFIASGAQPFVAASALMSLALPTLLIRGDDPTHPTAGLIRPAAGQRAVVHRRRQPGGEAQRPALVRPHHGQHPLRRRLQLAHRPQPPRGEGLHLFIGVRAHRLCRAQGGRCGGRV